MPWTSGQASKHKKGMTAHESQTWAKVANETLANCLDKGGSQSSCEAHAIMIANSVVDKNKK